MSSRPRILVLFLLAALLYGCSDDSATDSTDEFRVVSVTPRNNANQVSLYPTVTVTFNENIDTLSITDSCVTIGEVVPYTVICEGKTLTVTLSATLNVDTTYQGRVSAELTGVSGDRLDNDYTWSFNTYDGVAYSWKESPDSAANQMNDVIWAQNKFVMVGADDLVSPATPKIFTSPDGVAWAEQSVPSGTVLNGITYFKNEFIAVGEDGIVLRSPDAISWTTVDAGTSRDLLKIASNDNVAIIADWGRVLRSENGIDWTIIDVPLSEYLYDICWTGTMFVAATDSDSLCQVLTSPDGVSWEKRTIDYGGSRLELYGVAASNDLIIAVGTGAKVFTSEDGSNWTTNNIDTIYPYFENAKLYDVIWGGDRFVVVGGAAIMSPGGLTAASFDGTIWDYATYRYDHLGYFTAVAWSGERFVAASKGMDGLIVYSP